MAMKLTFEAEMKNAQELTRTLREIETYINNADVASAKFTKSMGDMLDSLQKGSSGIDISDMFKGMSDDLQEFKGVSTEAGETLKTYFIDTAKKAAETSRSAFKGVGEEIKQLNKEMVGLKKTSDEYKAGVELVNDALIRQAGISRNIKGNDKVVSDLERSRGFIGPPLPLGSRRESASDVLGSYRQGKGVMSPGNWGGMGEAYSAAGTMGKAAMIGGGALAALGTTALLANFASGQVIKTSQYGAREAVGAQAIAMGGLQSALGGNYSETLAEQFGQAGRVRSGKLTDTEKFKYGWRKATSLFQDTESQLLERQAQEHLRDESPAFKYYSEGMKHRVRISNQFRSLGQTYGDVQDRYAGIQGGAGVGQQGMDQMFGIMQGMQMMPGQFSQGGSSFYQGMQQFGMSPAMMQQIARQQRTGKGFSATQGSETMVNLLSAAGLSDPDQEARKYVTGIMAQSMAGQQTDIYSLGAAAGVRGAVGGAINKFSGINSMYISQKAVLAQQTAFAPINQAGSYENSLLREQLRTMGVDTTMIDTFLKQGGATNPQVMQSMADAMGMPVEEFRDSMYSPVRQFHSGQNQMMEDSMSSTSKKFLHQTRMGWAGSVEGDISKFYKQKFGKQSFRKTFDANNKTYSNDAKGYADAARDKASSLSVGITAYSMAKTQSLGEAAAYLNPEDIDLFNQAGIGKDRKVIAGRETAGVTQEQKTADLVSVLTKAMSGEEGTVWGSMDNNLQKIKDYMEQYNVSDVVNKNDEPSTFFSDVARGAFPIASGAYDMFDYVASSKEATNMMDGKGALSPTSEGLVPDYTKMRKGR